MLKRIELALPIFTSGTMTEMYLYISEHRVRRHNIRCKYRFENFCSVGTSTCRPFEELDRSVLNWCNLERYFVGYESDFEDVRVDWEPVKFFPNRCYLITFSGVCM